MKRFKYPALVKTEAKNLRKFATKEELDKLIQEDFNPRHSDNCIYGLLTGNCDSPRAIELIKSCAPRVYKSGNYVQIGDNDWVLSNKLNGSPKKISRVEFWSPIECFIYPNKQKEAAIRLLKYLKGEIKTL